MKNNTTSTRVYLIRHGSTDWIEQGILHDISEIEINNIAPSHLIRTNDISDLNGKAIL